LQRSFVELEKALLYHFKSLKMEKNWERFFKMFGDKHIYQPTSIYHKLGTCLNYFRFCAYHMFEIVWSNHG
jgi:hypothetical protein